MGIETGEPRNDASRLELGDIFRAYSERFLQLTPDQAQAVNAIMNCRTRALGGHVKVCTHCGHREPRYNSCRNRNCPKCQGLDQARWLASQQDLLLPVEYHHVVFTIPDVLNGLFQANPEISYNLLFGAVASTLTQVAANPEHLGAEIGFTAVLHTWTQKLMLHPHIHCIVPGGGLARGEERWVKSKPGFLLPVKVLSMVFRGVLLGKLERAAQKGIFSMPVERIAALLKAAATKKWVVYSKPPVAGPEQVLAYLGRYTSKGPLSNSRLVSFEEDRVTFRYRDRKDGNQVKLLTLPVGDFVGRLLRHVLPKALVRIRHYGLLANTNRRTTLVVCRRLLAVPEKGGNAAARVETWAELMARLTGEDVTRCPLCKVGQLLPGEELPPEAVPWSRPGRATSP